MNSRERIIQALAANQPYIAELPAIPNFIGPEDPVDAFISVAESVGSKCFKVTTYPEIQEIIEQQYKSPFKTISLIQELNNYNPPGLLEATYPHVYENLDLAIIKGHFSVAENGATWITEDLLGQRVIPFITQHLAIVVEVQNIVRTMHEAYERIADQEYGFGVFIAGPSKTADIEQSLALGAHGPRSLTLFLKE